MSNQKDALILAHAWQMIRAEGLEIVLEQGDPEGLDFVAEHIIQEAAQQGVQSDKCPDCDGKGWFGAQFCEGEECPTCEGTGICR